MFLRRHAEFVVESVMPDLNQYLSVIVESSRRHRNVIEESSWRHSGIIVKSS